MLPHPFPERMGAVLRVALKRATDANYHLSFLPHIAPWLLQYRANSAIERRIRFANLMRPLFARGAAGARGADAGVGRDALPAQGRLAQGLPHAGRLRATARERALATEFGLPHDGLDRDAVLALEPALAPQFVNAVHWKSAASVTNPLALTRAYIARFTALGGVVLTGDARTLHRASDRWRVETDEGPVDSREAVVALGPWATDLLKPMDIDLPLEVKRGYHLHFRPRGNAGLTRPVVDAELGYCVAPMEQGLRLTTGAEFARPRRAADAGAVRPAAAAGARAVSARRAGRGAAVDGQPAVLCRLHAGDRPRARANPTCGSPVGHAHWGLTLGPATGRLLAEMMTGATPFCDPTPLRGGAV